MDKTKKGSFVTYRLNCLVSVVDTQRTGMIVYRNCWQNIKFDKVKNMSYK
jgi:hypothetical protein